MGKHRGPAGREGAIEDGGVFCTGEFLEVCFLGGLLVVLMVPIDTFFRSGKRKACILLGCPQACVVARRDSSRGVSALSMSARSPCGVGLSCS